MPSDTPNAFDLIEEARFARRMLAITDASLAKIEACGPPAGPTRLEVPTVSAAGWSDAVLYVIRTERAKATPVRKIAAMLERMFAVEVSVQVLLAGVLHFDLDRCAQPVEPVAAEPAVTEVAVESDELAPETPCNGMTGTEWAAAQATARVEDATSQVAPVADPVGEKDADWKAEAIRLYDSGKGLNPFAISKQLGVTDYAVRKAVIPGYGTREGRDFIRSVAARPMPSLPPVSVPKPQPREPETKPRPKPAPARRAVSKAPPVALPWSPPARTAAGCNSQIPAPGKGLHILALESQHCRWLMGPGSDGHETYCGCAKSVHGSAYCDEHAKRAFNEWPPRTPLPKRQTRMARAVSALPDARNHRRA